MLIPNGRMICDELWPTAGQLIWKIKYDASVKALSNLDCKESHAPTEAGSIL